MVSYTPSEANQLITELFVGAPTFGKPKEDETAQFARPKLRLNGNTIRLKLKGTFFYGPELQKAVDWKVNRGFSLGVEFEEDDLEVIDKVMHGLSKWMPPPLWTPKEPHTDGKIFFKLPTDNDGKNFKFKHNAPTLKPTHLNDTTLNQTDQCTVDISITAWAMKDEDPEENKHMYGLTLKLNEVFFGEEEAKPAPKKRAPPKPKTETEPVVKKPKTKGKAKVVVEKVSESVVDSDEGEGEE